MVIGIVGVITAGIVFFVMKDASADSNRQSAEAPAIGFVATPTRWHDGDDYQEGHTLTFSFVDASNGVHAHTMNQVSWYDPAKSYKVCYNPQDPKDWKLYAAEHECGS